MCKTWTPPRCQKLSLHLKTVCGTQRHLIKKYFQGNVRIFQTNKCFIHIKLTPQDIIVKFKLIGHTFSLLALNVTYSFHKKETYNSNKDFQLLLDKQRKTYLDWLIELRHQASSFYGKETWKLSRAERYYSRYNISVTIMYIVSPATWLRYCLQFRISQNFSIESVNLAAKDVQRFLY